MIDALGEPQSRAAARRHQRHRARDRASLVRDAGGRAVVLAARPGTAARRRGRASCARWRATTSTCVDFDADRHRRPPGAGRARSPPIGDIDVALVAFGVLGDEEEAWQDHDAAVRAGAEVNYTGAGQRRRRASPRCSGGRATARSSCCRRSPASGCAARTSSTARRKAGMDGFYQGLGEALREHGGQRARRAPGLRAHQDDRGPRARRRCRSTAEQVADAVVAGVAAAQASWSGCPPRCAA